VFRTRAHLNMGRFAGRVTSDGFLTQTRSFAELGSPSESACIDVSFPDQTERLRRRWEQQRTTGSGYLSGHRTSSEIHPVGTRELRVLNACMQATPSAKSAKPIEMQDNQRVM
jgi:hypothetical protein